MGDTTRTVAEVRTRADDRSLLDELSHRLVDEHLAACVHVRGPERTLYRWQGELVLDDEHELTAVTATDRVAAVAEAIGAAHPYDVPSVLSTTVSTTADYAAWVEAETR